MTMKGTETRAGVHAEEDHRIDEGCGPGRCEEHVGSNHTRAPAALALSGFVFGFLCFGLRQAASIVSPGGEIYS